MVKLKRCCGNCYWSNIRYGFTNGVCRCPLPDIVTEHQKYCYINDTVWYNHGENCACWKNKNTINDSTDKDSQIVKDLISMGR